MNQDKEDAERWRQWLKGEALLVEGVTDKGKPWTCYYSPNDSHEWAERFTESIDKLRNLNE